MPKTTGEIEADWRAAMADPDGPRQHILGSAEKVRTYFYHLSNLTRDDMDEIAMGSIDGWGRRLWKKLSRDGNDESIVNMARLLGVGQEMGWIIHNSKGELFMNTDSDDLTGLMWQVALTNWDATKSDLTLSHLQTMVRIGLRNLEMAVLHRSTHPHAYSVDDAEKGLAKLTLLVTELNERMRKLQQRPALPEGDKS